MTKEERLAQLVKAAEMAVEKFKKYQHIWIICSSIDALPNERR